MIYVCIASLIPLFFALKRRSAQVKVWSVALPFAVTVGCAMILHWRVILPPLIIGAVALPFVALLVVPHTLSIFVRRDRWLYIGVTVLMWTVPGLFAVDDWVRAREQKRIDAQIRFEAQPEIGRCCAGVFEACANTADAFKKLGEQRLNEKYLAIACETAKLHGCEAHEACDARDLSSPF